MRVLTEAGTIHIEARDVVSDGFVKGLLVDVAQHVAKAADAKVPNYEVNAEWDVSENTGRRYALTSGDFNLIHIHAITAKAFGFKQAIAHGMWSKARALASLSLPDAYEADVWFKLPMYLPSKVQFATATSGQDTDFLIRNSKSQKPHVSGSIKAI